MRLNLPPRPASTMRRGRSNSIDRRVAPREAVERHLQAEARAGAVAVGVLARQPPVDHEVVVELGVVGDVGEVLEDLLARTGDGDLDADGIHGAGVYPRVGQAARRATRVCPRSECWTTSERSGGRRAAGPAQLADERAVGEDGAPARRRAGCARSRRSSPVRRPARRRSCAATRARDRLRRCRAGAATWASVRRRPPASCRVPLVAGPLTLVFGSVSRVAQT